MYFSSEDEDPFSKNKKRHTNAEAKKKRFGEKI
jgi:hypothetical protein